jgi:S-DNA-T family DNA segregation ATPase FtsK/SpoIIIE
MPIIYTHVLAAARTGGGKGSIVWSLVLQLAPAWKVGLVKFWGCDPKRLELSIGRDWWEHYADTDEGMVELLELAVKEMFERGSQLQGVARKFTPSRKTPLNVIVIDELGYLSSLLTDRKLQMRADFAIKTLLTQGRSNGYAVVGCVQDPRKATVEYRDLFPIRIAGGLNEAKMVDLILGEGMHAAGAVCEQIPMGRTGAGVAFVLDAERSMKPLLVRAAWCSDVRIRNTLPSSVRFQAEAFDA